MRAASNSTGDKLVLDAFRAAYATPKADDEARLMKLAAERHDLLPGIIDAIKAGCRSHTETRAAEQKASKGWKQIALEPRGIPHPHALAEVLATAPGDPYGNLLDILAENEEFRGGQVAKMLSNRGYRAKTAEPLLHLVRDSQADVDMVRSVAVASPAIPFGADLFPAEYRPKAADRYRALATAKDLRVDVPVAAWLLMADAANGEPGDLPCPPIAPRQRDGVMAAVEHLTGKHPDAALRVLSAVAAAPDADVRVDNLRHDCHVVHATLRALDRQRDPEQQRRQLAARGITLAYDAVDRRWHATRDGADVVVAPIGRADGDRHLESLPRDTRRAITRHVLPGP
jgi:hypothetical protein